MIPTIALGVIAGFPIDGGIEYVDTPIDLTIGHNVDSGVDIYGFNSAASTILGAVPFGVVDPDSFLGQDFYSFAVIDRSGVSLTSTLELTFVGSLPQNFFDQLVIPGVGTFNVGSVIYYGTDYPSAGVGTIWDWELTGPFDLTIGDTITAVFRNIV